MVARSVNTVPSSAGSITCATVIVTPGNFDTATHILGESTRMTVNVVVGPLSFAVSFAPTTKSPSIFAALNTSPGHSDGFVQTAQTVDTGAEHLDDPSKDRRRLLIMQWSHEAEKYQAGYDCLGAAVCFPKRKWRPGGWRWCNRPRAHILPTFCPQLHITLVVLRDVFMQVALETATSSRPANIMLAHVDDNAEQRILFGSPSTPTRCREFPKGGRTPTDPYDTDEIARPGHCGPPPT
jgi:hypothetical protein